MGSPQVFLPGGSDHPREYGENVETKAATSTWEGSSPRIRGKSFHTCCHGTPIGIIPANTGKILLDCSEVTAYGDHPREYGENIYSRRMLCLSVGSSPRIRGKSGAALCRVHEGGIIPANTGKIIRHKPHIKIDRDHPREYGENDLFTYGRVWLAGSSPRIRGKCLDGFVDTQH